MTMRVPFTKSWWAPLSFQLNFPESNHRPNVQPIRSSYHRRRTWHNCWLRSARLFSLLISSINLSLNLCAKKKFLLNRPNLSFIVFCIFIVIPQLWAWISKSSLSAYPFYIVNVTLYLRSIHAICCCSNIVEVFAISFYAFCSSRFFSWISASAKAFFSAISFFSSSICLNRSYSSCNFFCI